MPETFNFSPERNVPETLPRAAPTTTMSTGGWQFVAKPSTPYQRKFKITLYGIEWYTNADGTYDFTTNPNFNARALERFYERNETWCPFIFKHQHFGDITVRFDQPLTVPAGGKNGGGLCGPIEMTLIHHNPGYT